MRPKQGLGIQQHPYKWEEVGKEGSERDQNGSRPVDNAQNACAVCYL